MPNNNLLKNYAEQAITTALPTAMTLNYTLPGLVAEIGEVYGVIAKAHRDGWDDDRKHKTLVAEWGDVAWMTAVSLHLLGADRVTLPKTPEQEARDTRLPRLMDTAVLAAFHNTHNPPHGDLLEILTDAWGIVVNACEHITGSSIETVLQANLNKLQDRKARGVIGGSGDNR